MKTLKNATKINETEQKLIRKDMEEEHMKLLGNNLDLTGCDKKTNGR